MKLTHEQQKVVEDNMGLVGKVIHDRVHGISQTGAFSYDDLFQIGCIGLIKAAATDQGACFSTYAYRLIWNEICDALRKATRLNQYEESQEPAALAEIAHQEILDCRESTELHQMLLQAESRATGVTAKGIHCLKLTASGYSSKDLETIYRAKAATIRMWMTKARRYLLMQAEFLPYVYKEDSCA